MTDKQFKEFMEMVQGQMAAQTKAMKEQAKALNKMASAICSTDSEEKQEHEDICSELKFLRNAAILQNAFTICKTRTSSNTLLQEQGGLTGAIADVTEFLKSSQTPESWNEYVINEIFVKTFCSKPLKVEND